jgi:hypothetical protein
MKQFSQPFEAEERERVRKDSIRVEVKRNIWGKARGALHLRGKKSILLEGTQAMPARPSDKGLEPKLV